MNISNLFYGHKPILQDCTEEVLKLSLFFKLKTLKNNYLFAEERFYRVNQTFKYKQAIFLKGQIYAKSKILELLNT